MNQIEYYVNLQTGWINKYDPAFSIAVPYHETFTYEGVLKSQKAFLSYEDKTWVIPCDREITVREYDKLLGLGIKAGDVSDTFQTIDHRYNTHYYHHTSKRISIPEEIWNDVVLSQTLLKLST